MVDRLPAGATLATKADRPADLAGNPKFVEILGSHRVVFGPARRWFVANAQGR